MRIAVTLLVLLAVRAGADWVNELRLTLANYALSKAADPPTGFLCDTIGKKHNSCHCWNDKGEPEHHQTDDDCHMPAKCLMYSYKTDGNFHFSNISTNASVHNLLSSWGVPTGMYKEFDAAALVESADFAAFHLDINDHKAHFDAHVGTLRKWQGTIFLGYLFGKCDGDMVQPYKRTVKTGDCHGTNRGQKERGYTDKEVAMINEGLQAYAYKAAAKRVPPRALLAGEAL